MDFYKRIIGAKFWAAHSGEGEGAGAEGNDAPRSVAGAADGDPFPTRPRSAAGLSFGADDGEARADGESAVEAVKAISRAMEANLEALEELRAQFASFQNSYGESLSRLREELEQARRASTEQA